MDYTSTELKLWLEIDDKVVDVVSAVFAYTLNTIPQASIVVAAGANATTLKDSTAHAIARDSKLLVPAKLWLQANKGATSDQKSIVLDGKYCLFEGYLMLPGTAIQKESLNITMELTHWLSDLNFSSAVSASSHPENPANFTCSATILGGTDVFGHGETEHYLPVTLAQDSITPAAIAEDLWGEGILPWFKDLAAQDRINASVFGRNDTPNKAVQKALERFNGDKLPMDLEDLDVLDAAIAISEDIASTTFETAQHHILAMANVTLWDKLVGELSPLYRFAVVPGPTWAKVVPLVAGLRTDWKPPGHAKQAIYARDENKVEIQSQLTRLIGGFGLYSSLGSATGADTIGIPVDLSIGGTFVADETEGMIMIRRAPRWLDDIAFPAGLPPAAGVDGKVVADAMAPDEGKFFEAAGALGGGAKPGVNAKIIAAKGLMDRMAHSMYIDEVLGYRSAAIYSPLRFDICPGSTIAFEGQDVPNLKADVQPDVRYGMVIRVTYSINAGPPGSAHTIYSLAHIRNKAENKDDKTSIDRHPLYDRVWSGDELITKEP